MNVRRLSLLVFALIGWDSMIHLGRASDLARAGKEFKDADIRTVVSSLSRRLNLPVYMDASVSGKVEVIGPATGGEGDSELQLRAILEFNGYSMESVGNLRRIVKFKEPSRVSPFIPFQTEIPPAAKSIAADLESLAVHAFKLKHVGVNEILPVLRFLTSSSCILPYLPGNMILVVDNQLNLRRVAVVLSLLDVPRPARKICTFRLKYARARTVVDTISTLVALQHEDTSAPDSAPAKPTLIPDDRTNTIILYSLEEGAQKVKSLVEALDMPAAPGYVEASVATSADRPVKACEPSVPSPAPPVAPRAGARTIPDSVMHISRAEVDEYLDNINTVLREVNVEPVFERGQPAGFRLTSIEKGSILDRMGIQDGDTLRFVNGQRIDGIQSTFVIHNLLKEDNRIEVTVLRGGRPVTLRFAID